MIAFKFEDPELNENFLNYFKIRVTNSSYDYITHEETYEHFYGENCSP